MELSKNFKLSEFTNSTTAKVNKVDNTPTDGVINNLKQFARKLLQPIRNDLKYVIRINSGYRSKKLNDLVKGSKTSQHMLGQAADCIFIQDGVLIPPMTAAKAIYDGGYEFDQMIIYNTFVHLSYKGTKGGNRKQVLYNSSYTGPKTI